MIRHVKRTQVQSIEFIIRDEQLDNSLCAGFQVTFALLCDGGWRRVGDLLALRRDTRFYEVCRGWGLLLGQGF